MSDDNEVTLQVKGLDYLIMALKSKPPTIRVGILGSKAAREKKGHDKDNPTNAEIGAAHEFGSPARGIPQRSFLRIPLMERLQKEMENSGAISKAELLDVLKHGTFFLWASKIAILAEDIVLGAFDSGGYGKWPAWKAPGYSNNAGQLLVDTQQLRNSITSEVKA